MVLINLAIIFLLLMTSFTNGASNTRWQPVLIRKGRAVDIFPCRRPGFYRSLENCEVFFRCIRTSQSKEMLAYEFVCPDGLIFDERHEICNWPYLAPKCEAKGNLPNTVIMTGLSDPIKSRLKLPPTWEGHSTNEVLSQPKLKCKKSGFFKNNLECFKFYRCVLISSRQFYLYEFDCPQDTEFNEALTTCIRVSLDSNCAGEFKNTKRPTQQLKFKQGSTDYIQNPVKTMQPHEFNEITTQSMPARFVGSFLTTIPLPTVTNNLNIKNISRTTSIEESSTNINQESAYETTSIFTNYSATPLTEYNLEVTTLFHSVPLQNINQHIIFPDKKYLSKVTKTSEKFQTSTLGTNMDNLDHSIKIQDSTLDTLSTSNTTHEDITTVRSLSTPKYNSPYLSITGSTQNFFNNSKSPLSMTLPTIKTTHEEITTIQTLVTPKHHSTYLNKPLFHKTTIEKEEEITKIEKATTKMQLELTTGLDITHKPKVIRPYLPFTLTEKHKTIIDLPTDQPLQENIPKPDKLHGHGQQTKPIQISSTKLYEVEMHNTEKYQNVTLSPIDLSNKTLEISVVTESQINMKMSTSHYLPNIASTKSPENVDNVTIITDSNISEILSNKSHISDKDNSTSVPEYFTNRTETVEANHTDSFYSSKEGYTTISNLSEAFELINNETTASPVTKGTISLVDKVHSDMSNGTFEDNSTQPYVDNSYIFQNIHNESGLNASDINISHDDKIVSAHHELITNHTSEAYELIKNETKIAPVIQEINLNQSSSNIINKTTFQDHKINVEVKDHTNTTVEEITQATLINETHLNVTKPIITSSNHSEMPTTGKYEATTISKVFELNDNETTATSSYNGTVLPDQLHLNVMNNTIDPTLHYANVSHKPLDKTINQTHVNNSADLNISNIRNLTAEDTNPTTAEDTNTTTIRKTVAFNLIKNETSIEPLSYDVNLTSKEMTKNESNINITENNLSTKKPTNASNNQSMINEMPSNLPSALRGNLTIDTTNITKSTLNVNITDTSYEVKPTSSPIESLSSNTTHFSEPFELSYNETNFMTEQKINKTSLNEHLNLTRNLTFDQEIDHTVESNKSLVYENRTSSNGVKTPVTSIMKTTKYVSNESLEITQNNNLNNSLNNATDNNTMDIFLTTFPSSGNITHPVEQIVNDSKHNITSSTEPSFTITFDFNDNETEKYNSTTREAMEIITDNGTLLASTNGKQPNSIKFTGKVKHYGNITSPKEPFTVKAGIRVSGESSNIIEIIQEELLTTTLPVKSHPIKFVQKPHQYQSTHSKNKEFSNDDLFESFTDNYDQIERNLTMEIIPNVIEERTNIIDPKLEIILKHSSEYPVENHLPDTQTLKDDNINIVLPEDKNSIAKGTVDDRENQIKYYGASNEIFIHPKSYLKLSESTTSSPLMTYSTTKSMYIYEDEYDSDLNSTETPEDWTLSIIPDITSRMLRRLVMNSLSSNQTNYVGPQRYVLTKRNKNTVK